MQEPKTHPGCFIKGRPSSRLSIAMMMFLACLVNYMMRVNMSVNILSMVPKTFEDKLAERKKILRSYTTNTTTTNITDNNNFEELVPLGYDGHAFDWSETIQGYVLASYFWGYAMTCVFGGTTAEYFGPKKVITVTMLISSAATLVCPMCARAHWTALIAARITCGGAGGFLYPALHALVARWAPPAEKGRFVSALLGGAIGTVITWSASGPIIEALGWDAGFYLPGIIALVWCIAWWYVVFDSPFKHPRIIADEKAYIVESLGDKLNFDGKKRTPPVKKILRSVPFLAMAILHFGSNWGLFFIMTAAPKFVSSCLKFDLTKTGFLSSLPYLARMACSLAFGSVGDTIIKQHLMPLTFMRKFFTIFSHIIPGTFLVLIGYTSDSPYVSVAFITLAIGSNGAACLTNLANHQDLAPNYAGTLYGFANGLGNTAGFITPLVTAYFTKDGHGFAQWRPVFLVGASVYVATAIFFIFFGTSRTQVWNDTEANLSMQPPVK